MKFGRMSLQPALWRWWVEAAQACVWVGGWVCQVGPPAIVLVCLVAGGCVRVGWRAGAHALAIARGRGLEGKLGGSASEGDLQLPNW